MNDVYLVGFRILTIFGLLNLFQEVFAEVILQMEEAFATAYSNFLLCLMVIGLKHIDLSMLESMFQNLWWFVDIAVICAICHPTFY